MCSLTQSCPTLCGPITVACQTLCMKFSMQEYCSGLPFPAAEDLATPGIKPASLVSQGLNLCLSSPALADGFLALVPPGNPLVQYS